jgi:uncharacterized protein
MTYKNNTLNAFIKQYKRELWIGFLFILVFVFFYFLNIPKITESVLIGLRYVNLYAREHILFSLVPALFIAGAISQLMSTGPVIRILSGKYGKTRAYLIASISGSILSVCSCTILPIFSGIYRTGAGLGPAIAFLFAGPAISVIAIAFTAVVIGWKLALARIISSIIISITIGLIMEKLFETEENDRINKLAPVEGSGVALWKSVLIIISITFVLISATWSFKTPEDANEINPMPGVEATIFDDNQSAIEPVIPNVNSSTSATNNEIAKEVSAYDRFAMFIFEIKWYLTGFFLFLTLLFSFLFLKLEQVGGWMNATWQLAKEMLPLLFAGVFVAGFLFNVIPSSVIESLFGNNNILSNLLASVLGVGTYFANCTEVAIIDVLTKNGMSQGPALSLLLSGPVVSPPSLIITWSILGPKKTITYAGFVIAFSALAGYIYGLIV